MQPVNRAKWQLESYPMLMLFFPLYVWWKRHTKSRKTSWYGYRENLCHYLRVVLIWAPLQWFFVVPCFNRIRFVRPWMITVMLCLTGFLAYALWQWPNQTLAFLREFAKSFGLGLVGAVVAIAVLALVALFLDVVGKILGLFWRKLCSPVLRWFFLSRRWYVVSPWSVTLAGLLTASVVFLGTGKTLKILEFIGFGLLYIAFFAGVVAGISATHYAFVRRKLRRQRQRAFSTTTYSRPRAATKPHLSTVRLMTTTVWDQHNRICPLLDLPDTSESDW